MGLWDNIKKVSKAVGKEALEQGTSAIERSQQYKQEMSMKTDEALFMTIKNERKDSPMKAGAAKQELENRGYDNNTIMARVR